MITNQLSQGNESKPDEPSFVTDTEAMIGQQNYYDPMEEAYHTDQKVQAPKGPFKSINLQKRFQSEYGTDNEIERVAVSNLSAASIKNPQALKQNDYEGKLPIPMKSAGDHGLEQA